MKVYKVVTMVIDFDGVGDSLKELIENARYPNHCVFQQVTSIQEADIGEWTDEHPLNNKSLREAEFNRLFKDSDGKGTKWEEV